MSKRVLQGVVVSDACDKTVIVRVERRVMHPVYKKFITQSKKYAAHDQNNQFQIGNAVQIEESRPISKRKHWVVLGSVGAGTEGSRTSDPVAVVRSPTDSTVDGAAETKREADVA
jgi:small subunit ribosomal protein S17